jgi:hypothetical protein
MLPGLERARMNPEEELIKAFFVPTKRERYLERVANPKKRKKFLNELYHFKALDPRCSVSIPPSQQYPEQSASILTKRGAPPTCWVTSTESRDGWEGNAPFGGFEGRSWPTNFEGEERGDRWILELRSEPLKGGTG